MGKPVTLDSDDVEAMLLAAAFGTMVQQQAVTYQDDPAYQRQKPRFQDALDRVRRARGDAIREVDPESLREPTHEEHSIMLEIEDAGDFLRADDIEQFSSLRLIGMVLFGTINLQVKWGDKSQESHTDTRIAVRLTQKARDFLKKHRSWEQRKIRHDQSQAQE